MGRRAHFLGVCGNAMGGIAAALVRAGWTVTGSAEDCFSPMREYLAANGIAFRSPYQASNVPPDTDVVVVAKRVHESNPELRHILECGIPYRSFPEFLREVFLSRSRNAVVAGGVGKTTTTAMLAWILQHAGLRPDFLIGGLARNFTDHVRFDWSSVAVLEGDEYPSGFDDPRPKFLHYEPQVAVITNVIEDHPDVYPDKDALCGAFAALIDSIPAHGCLVVPDWDESASGLAARARCRVISTGRTARATEPITDEAFQPDSSRFRLMGVDFEIPQCGHMNVSNAAMAAIAATMFGVAPERSADALRVFEGVRNRQEELPIGRVTLVLDKATHPHALLALAEALRQRFPGRRLVSVIQPRATGGRHWVYQRDLPIALARFDRVILTSPDEYRPLSPRPWADAPFSIDLLATTLASQSVESTLARTPEELADAIEGGTEQRDVVVLSVLEHSKALARTVMTSLGRLRAETTTGGVSP